MTPASWAAGWGGADTPGTAATDRASGATGRGGAGRPDAHAGRDSLDTDHIKSDFPVLAAAGDGDRIVYLDSASSSQKPRQVIDAMSTYYESSHANVHRGLYRLASEADRLYEEARTLTGRFIGATDPEREVVFTKNSTESINLVSFSWGYQNLQPGDVVVATEMEHHANIVPWINLHESRGIELRIIPLGDDYELDLTSLDELLDGAKLVACTLMSNVLGTVPPFRRIADAAHAAGALVLADGAQLVPHSPVDVRDLGCDFLAFSGHKMLGPTGIGVLWGRAELLDSMPPFMGGGGMIRDVRFEGIVPADIPTRFEAGTPPIAEAVGLGAAIRYLEALGMDRIQAHGRALTEYAVSALTARLGAGIEIMHPLDPEAGAVLSLALPGVHPHDVAQVLADSGICVRAGHHCAKPLMRRLGVGATARASMYLYNDESDIDALGDALERAAKLFG